MLPVLRPLAPRKLWSLSFSYAISRSVRGRYYSSAPPPYLKPGPPPLPSKEQREWEEQIRRRQQPAAHPEEIAKEEEKLTLHPDARRPIKPDFEGDTNPVTGEIGGPKKEPLQWGAQGEWTYGGRATDF